MSCRKNLIVYFLIINDITELTTVKAQQTMPDNNHHDHDNKNDDDEGSNA